MRPWLVIFTEQKHICYPIIWFSLDRNFSSFQINEYKVRGLIPPTRCCGPYWESWTQSDYTQLCQIQYNTGHEVRNNIDPFKYKCIFTACTPLVSPQSTVIKWLSTTLSHQHAVIKFIAKENSCCTYLWGTSSHAWRCLHGCQQCHGGWLGNHCILMQWAEHWRAYQKGKKWQENHSAAWHRTSCHTDDSDLWYNEVCSHQLPAYLQTMHRLFWWFWRKIIGHVQLLLTISVYVYLFYCIIDALLTFYMT